MNNRPLLCGVFAFAALNQLVFALPGCGQESEGFRTIFDGKTLTGWQGDPQYWRVEGGAIVGEIPRGERLGHNTWLVWNDGELADFELRLQFRLSGLPAANSGIQFRCQVENVGHVSGYQADLDMGATWLGRIYDEHGRALLVERGSRVRIDEAGDRHVETFAPAGQYAALFRENDWNDYRIVCKGAETSVYINNTLFSQLVDKENGEADLSGKLAFQLHSGPQTRIAFRNVRLRDLENVEIPKIEFTRDAAPENEDLGTLPRGRDGKALNLDFERGSLADWKASGDAFNQQPVRRDGIAARWPGQTSRKQGDFFLGGFEIVRDRGTGTLESEPFVVTHPYASFLVGGGSSPSTRIEIVAADQGAAHDVLFTASGEDREQMRRVVVDLRDHQGKSIAIRVIDESSGGWGHVNFDDFRFHDQPPNIKTIARDGRTTHHPLLHHLQPVDRRSEPATAAERTVAQMYVPEGFTVDVVAAEPELHQPMAFTFDERGRLWVVEGHSYPQKRPEGEGLDKILIFADEDADGSFESRKVFAEGLNLVSGLEVGYGGVWIGAAPELLFIPDRDHDDRPDGPPEVLLNGFGYADTHETLNSFTWGPDGWLYGNQGVFNRSRIGPPDADPAERIDLSAGVWRYHPIRKSFEVFAHGGSNQWGLDFDLHGQLFMTHCRSRWGRGPTTHVIQGGRYWNQTNSGHAPFISPVAPAGLEFLQNFMLASARYGHGEGGAGKPGSRALYGGHSHVGTMIYLGDNWPSEYRNHLFTHNLHGHQLNHQVNVREFGGYNTLHAGRDMLLCVDPQYIGVDLKYGPDGAVYVSDWYDPRHCHNPVVEQWDRGNGRLYRIQYAANYRPVKVDLSAYSESELQQSLSHPNEWYVRTALRLIRQRAAQNALSASFADRLFELAMTEETAATRLRALWALHAAGGLTAERFEQIVRDENEFVRGWAIQLITDSRPVSDEIGDLLPRLAQTENSLLVRRYFASAIQRLQPEAAWKVAEVLGKQPENAADRNLELLMWYGVAPLMADDLERGLKLGESASSSNLQQFIYWYAAKQSAAGRDRMLELIREAAPNEQSTMIDLLAAAVRDQRDLAAPRGWSQLAAQWYRSDEPKRRRTAERLGAAFGDHELFAALRQRLTSPSTSLAARKHALELLELDKSPAKLPVLLDQLDEPQLRSAVLVQVGQFDDPAIADVLLRKLSQWPPPHQTTVMNVVTNRASWAARLLSAIEDGDVDKSQLTAYYARKIAGLENEALTNQLTALWGRVGSSTEEQYAEIQELAAAYKSAPLWAYSEGAGKQHFTRLCANCHAVDNVGENIGPKLAGSGSKGIDYLVENIIAPNAVIGEDYQARVILLSDGRVINGLVTEESPSAVTVRTTTDVHTLAKSDIERIVVSQNSFMPEELLKSLNQRERIELLKFLMAM